MTAEYPTTYAIKMPQTGPFVLHDICTVWGVNCYRTRVFTGPGFATQVSEVLRPIQTGDQA